MDDHTSFAVPRIARRLAAVLPKPKRNHRQRQTRALRFAKRAEQESLQVAGVTVDGIELRLGTTEPALTPLEAWREKRRARST